MEAVIRMALVWLCERVIGLLVAAMAGLAVLQVVLRYGFGAALLWVEEVSVILLIWLAWIGITYLWLTRAHILVDLVPAMLDEAGRRRLASLIDLLALAGGGALFVVSLDTVAIFSGMDLGSIALDAAVKYYPITAGAAGLAAAAALNLWRRAGGGEAAR